MEFSRCAGRARRRVVGVRGEFLEFWAAPPPGYLRNSIILKEIDLEFAKQCDSIGFRLWRDLNWYGIPTPRCFCKRVGKLLRRLGIRDKPN
jgi:hypothetical protein